VQINARLWFPTLFAVLDHHIGVDAATHKPFGGDAHETGLAGLGQVGQDVVGDFFVESAVIAVAPHIHLQAFELNALLVRDVVNREVRKVGLAGEGAKAGELWDLELDDVVALRCRVVKHVEYA